MREQPDSNCNNELTGDSQLSLEDALAVVHELKTNQIKLEKQIKELQADQTTVAESSEKKLDVSHALLHEVIEQSPIPIAIASPTGQMIFNTTFAEHLKIADDPQLRQSVNLFDLIPIWQYFDADGNQIPVAELPLAKSLRGETTKGLEIRIVHQDGTERWKIVNAAPIYDDAGEIIAGTVSFSDITKLKCIEQRLKVSERESRAWLDCSPICTKKIDLDFNLQYMSCAGVTALGIDDITEYYGKPYPIEFYPDSFKDGMKKKLVKVMESGKVATHESSIANIDGDTLWFHSTLVPVFDEDQKIEYIIVVSIEITERKQAEDQSQELNARLMEQTSFLHDMATRAEAANIAKSEFLANMSHEIRTPMTAILGFAEIMAENICKPENIETINTIRRNGEYLLNLINDILDVSKIEAGKMDLDYRLENPCKIVAEVAELIQLRARAKGLDFNVEFVGNIPEIIHTDLTRLRQILINLVGNAVKFTEQGEVKIITSFIEDGDASYIQFDVLDTGVGITEEQISGLFRPFTQADGSTTRKFGGTGLGLTISKQFAELLGGDISIVESEIGVGSRFRATISTGLTNVCGMHDDPDSFNEHSDTQPSVAAIDDLSGLRILIAEDGQDNQRLISHLLRKAGANTELVENGKLAVDAALEALKTDNPFDCILMDMQMPIMSGYEATTVLREAGYNAPIIALTAHTMTGDRENCINSGCDDFAKKPIDRARLIGQIAQQSKRWSAAA